MNNARKPGPNSAKIQIGRTLEARQQEDSELSEVEEGLQPIGIFYPDDEMEADFWFHWST